MTLAVILAGGKGSRMGGNKPLHPYGGATLIEAVVDRLRPQAETVVINAGSSRHALREPLTRLGVPIVLDGDWGERGPLSGVLTALKLARAQGRSTVITTPCDMPDLPPNFVTRLINAAPADVVHFTGAGDYPLCALWRTSLLTRLENALALVPPENGLAVRRFLGAVNVHRVAVFDESAFRNINTPEDA